MTVLWTAEDAAAAMNGAATGTWTASGVSIDSRTVQPGDLFFALKGPRVDGHDYVADALSKGAAAAVVDHVPAGVEAAQVVTVDDTFTALQDLGQVARLRAQAGVIALTGSVGKTTAKDMLRVALSPQGLTEASAASHNNHWGVPFSLGKLPQQAAYGVFELGMNHAGEIRDLVQLVKPDVAMILNIHPVHIENFDDIAGIARAKAEILEGLERTGTAILPRDSEQFHTLLAAARTQGIETILTFGESADCDAQVLAVTDQGPSQGMTVKAMIMDEVITFTLGLDGKPLALTAVAVLLAVKAVGGDVNQAAETFATLKPLAGRGAVVTVPWGAGALTVIDGSYNASVPSMRLGLETLHNTPAKRRIAVLGDMLELGDQAATLHAQLIEPLRAVDRIYTCGAHMQAVANPFPKAIWATDSESLIPPLLADLQAGDAVLIKGSNGMKLAKVLNAIKVHAEASAMADPAAAAPAQEVCHAV